jgi:hypothetical protein
VAWRRGVAAGTLDSRTHAPHERTVRGALAGYCASILDLSLVAGDPSRPANPAGHSSPSRRRRKEKRRGEGKSHLQVSCEVGPGSEPFSTGVGPADWQEWRGGPGPQ